MINSCSLRFAPVVCAVEEEYEILIATKTLGMVLVQIGDEIYHDTRAGICRAESNYFKIRVPQAALDAAKKYTVVFRPSLGKQSYFTKFGRHEPVTFSFRPVEKTENIRMYHVADVHGYFGNAQKTVSYFGDGVDLFVVNGDIFEYNTEEGYLDTLAFLAEIGEGRVPMIFSRGNHDTRGRLSERYPEFFPCVDGNSYYTVKVGPLSVLVLDCGEDKPDKGPEYDNTEDVPEKYRGLNRFHEYRRAEACFLASLADKGEKFDFAVSHVCPNMTTFDKTSMFNIDADVYADWTASLEKMGIKFMLCGHYHKCFLLEKDDAHNIVPHAYPVVVASDVKGNDFLGGAITYFPDRIDVAFTNMKHEIVEHHEISLA